MELPAGTAMIFISEKLKDDCMTEALSILRHLSNHGYPTSALAYHV